jgi:hypothetical protein
MLRSFALLLVLIPVAIVGYLYSLQVRGSGGSKPVTRQISDAAQAAATFKLRQADTALEQARSLNGTFAGADLSTIGVTLARADATSYCIQTGVSPLVLHETGPQGAVAPGAC